MTADTARDPVPDGRDVAGRGSPGRRRRVIAMTVRVLLCGLLALVWGVTTASVEYSFGPHEARYEITTDSTVTLDVGPLGTVQIDSPVPLGGRITVQEIPQDVVALGQVTTLEALSSDLERYVQFFNAPQATLEGAIRGLVLDAVRRTVLAWGVLVAAVLGLRALLGPARRAELHRAMAPHRGVIARTAALVLVVLVGVTASSPQPSTSPGPAPSPVFAGTPLEGARVTGRLSGVIDTYGGLIIDAVEQNDRFYAGAAADLERAWRARAQSEAMFPFPTDPPETTVTMLVVSDLHCNVGMAPVIRRAAELSGADIILDAGDTTVNGTAVESYCITSLASAVPEGVEVVVATGNHDSEVTVAQQRAAGMTVLAGETVEVAGVRILGDQDPHATRIGSGTAPAGQETLAEAADRLAEVACADEAGIDLLLVHTPRVGDPTLQQGCAPVQVSGHMHTRIGPYLVGKGVRYVSGSTAGAALGQPTVGPLNAPAEITVLTFDLETREMASYRLVVIRPDGTALVGFRLDFPTARELGAVGVPGTEGPVGPGVDVG